MDRSKQPRAYILTQRLHPCLIFLILYTTYVHFTCFCFTFTNTTPCIDRINKYEWLSKWVSKWRHQHQRLFVFLVEFLSSELRRYSHQHWRNFRLFPENPLSSVMMWNRDHWATEALSVPHSVWVKTGEMPRWQRPLYLPVFVFTLKLLFSMSSSRQKRYDLWNKIQLTYSNLITS